MVYGKKVRADFIDSFISIRFKTLRLALRNFYLIEV